MFVGGFWESKERKNNEMVAFGRTKCRRSIPGKVDLMKNNVILRDYKLKLLKFVQHIAKHVKMLKCPSADLPSAIISMVGAFIPGYGPIACGGIARHYRPAMKPGSEWQWSIVSTFALYVDSQLLSTVLFN